MEKTASRWRNSYKYKKTIQYYALKKGDESVHIYFKYRGTEYKRMIGHKKRDKITEPKAKRELDRWKKEITMKSGKNSLLDVKFGELFEAYMFYAKVHLRSWRVKELHYEKHLREMMEKEKCVNIDDIYILGIQDFLQEKGLKFTSINVIVQLVITVLNYAVKHGLLEHSKVNNYEKMRGVITEKRFLLDDEVEKILSDAKKMDEDTYNFVALSLGLGGRAATTLKIRTVDVRDEKINLHDIKRGKDYTVNIDKHTMNIKALLSALPLSAKCVVPLSYQVIYRRVYKLLEPLNEGREDRATIHTFRHTFAYRFLREGMPLQLLRDRLNHSTIKTTEDFYEHLVG